MGNYAPPKVAYHPNVRCRRGDGCTCGEGPVIVGPMYRVGEVCVCEGAASAEEKAKGPVEPAGIHGNSVKPGFDLRGWEAADIQGLRGADGTLDLAHAILCGADLQKAELQGANLMMAQLQAADLTQAHLQAADLVGAHLQGAKLRVAQLQGARLNGAQLQGADLSYADLSVLPTGYPLRKQGSAGETEATEVDRPTHLTLANLSVLPKGSEYREWDGVRAPQVSDAARPTNLTGAKVSGATFMQADLSGADFTGATLKDATLKDATFAAHKPPERPASGALSGAWRAKAVMGGMARAAIVAADDDDDDDDESDGESEEEEEEEIPDGVEDKMKMALDACMSELATGAQVFMHTVDELLGKVEARKDSILADATITDRLCNKLKEVNVNQAAIHDILLTLVISPLLEQYLSEVLNEALSELPQPTDEAGAAGRQLLEELRMAFKERALNTGKAALLKRLSPIVNKCVLASSARVKSGPKVDEEQALMLQPKASANCLVQELWPALRASLEAQVSDVILSSALAPIEKVGKSVRWMAERLNKFEGALSMKNVSWGRTHPANAESQRFAKRFGLGGEKGGLCSRLLKTTLTAATKYEVSVGGFSGCFGMVSLAWTCSRAKLTKHENELEYLKEKLKKLEDMTTTEQTWRDVTETWQATLAMLKSVEVERGSAVLQCIASDEKLLKALGMAKTLYKVKGDVPMEVVVRLNDGAGAHIRTHAYKYDKLISLELVRIQRVKDIQWRAVTLSGSAVVATMIGAANLLSRLYYDVLESGDSRLAVLLPVGAVAVVGLLLFCCFAGYHHRWLMQLCAQQGLCGKCWPHNRVVRASPSSTSASAETEVAQARVAGAAGAANTLKPTTSNTEAADERV